MTRLKWAPIIERAAEIVREYETLVTLRQLFYRLVSQLLLPNTVYAYKHLSNLSAQGRREDTFPDLVDATRWIHRPFSWSSAADAQQWLRDEFRLDRTANQDVSLYLGVEKDALVRLLELWFGERGIPVLPLRGYASQTFADEVRRDVQLQQRPAVLIYAGDHDASGEDIDRDFIRRADCFNEVVRVALSPEQVAEFRLPRQPGKETDSRAEAFVAKHGSLIQVELDALPPDELRRLFEQAVDRFWDKSDFDAICEREADERQLLREAS